MDAHVFRRFGQALCPMLEGARLEKIQSPAEHVFVLSIYAQKRKQHLVLKASRKTPFLYFARQRPTVSAPPTAQIMRLRKYCAGRRIVSCSLDWLNRRLLLLFRSDVVNGVPSNQETWLVLDLRDGLSLVQGACPTLPPDDAQILWPQDILHLADSHWKQWPMLTPNLRRVIPHLDKLDLEALLMDLEHGGGDVFVYGQGAEAEILAWPLPKALVNERSEQVFDDPIVATSLLGDALVLGVAAQKERNVKATPHKREIARLERLLHKLQEEEVRLQGLVDMQALGLALQNIMWQYDPDVKMSCIETDDPKHGVIKLDPRYSLSANMQIFFHQAGRGRRGFSFLAKRRDKLQQQLHDLKNTMHAVLAGNVDIKPEHHVKNTKTIVLPKGVEAFYSTDKFLILRGKDAKGNWAALRMAAAHDLWLHVEGGPGSHCIIRRHFSGQEISENTLNEAAALAAIKSWQKDNTQAQIICAEARHVKPMRNAAPGMVRIDKVWRSFRVNAVRDIELRLSE